jgi:hypothetical protein
MSSKDKNPFFVEVEGNKVVGIVKEKPEAEAEPKEPRQELKISEINRIVNGLLGLKNDKNGSCGDKCGEPLDDPEEDIYDTIDDVVASDDDEPNISVLIEDQISKQFGDSRPMDQTQQSVSPMDQTQQSVSPMDQTQHQPASPTIESSKPISQIIETQLKEKLGTETISQLVEKALVAQLNSS